MRLFIGGDLHKATNTIAVSDEHREFVLTADCGDTDPHTPCMYEWLSKALDGTLCKPHAMRLNHTEIRCEKGSGS